MARTGGEWDVACDSYGKVRHSRKACVFTCIKNERGAELLVTVAARIENWDDARVMAAAPSLLAALKVMVERMERTGREKENALDARITEKAREAIAAAEGAKEV